MRKNKRFKYIAIALITFLLAIGGGISSQFFNQKDTDKILAEANTKANSAIAASETISDSGLVKISKTATPVDGMVNQWDITLRVEAKEPSPPPTTDIVLIVDTSGSMRPLTNEGELNGPDRMLQAINAAKNFTDQLLTEDSNVRIALVTFGTTVSNYTFTPIAANEFESSSSFVGFNRKDQLIEKIENLKAEGATFTQGAIKSASDLLKGSDAQSKNVILISDGAPTLSYMLKEPYAPNVVPSYSPFDKNYYEPTIHPDYLEPLIPGSVENSYSTLKDIPEGYFDYTKVTSTISGSSYFEYLGENQVSLSPNVLDVFYMNKAYNAIAEASYLKNTTNSNGQPLIKNFYTIGVDIDTLTNKGTGVADPDADPYVVATAREVLTEVASSPSKFYDINNENLGNILSEIGESIGSSLQDGVVIDPIGTGFKLEGEVIDSSATEGKVIVTTDSTSKKETIQWTFNELTTPISATDDTVYGELTYRVSANNDVLQTGVMNAAGLAKTNGITTLTYQTLENAKDQLEFIVPEVKPIIVSVSKILKDETGNIITDSAEKFSMKYGNDEYTAEDTFSVQANQSAVQVVHPWKANQPYYIEELLTSDQDYEVSIDINGVQTQGNNASWQFSSVYEEYEHQNIVVTNTRIVRSKTVFLNIRQAVLRPNQDLVIPEKAFYEGGIVNAPTELFLTSGSTTKDTSSEVNQTLFRRYQITLEEGQTAIEIADIIPEYYQFYGYILSSESSSLSTDHISSNTVDLQKNNLALIDYNTNNEYWLTMFVEPKLGLTSSGEEEESPRFYSWDYKTNMFGQ